MTHTVTYMKRQEWLAGGALPEDMARLIVRCEDLSAISATLASWDGMDFSARCPECGDWVHPKS